MAEAADVFLGSDAQRLIRESGASSGDLVLRHSPAHDMYVVASVGTSHTVRVDARPAKPFATLRADGRAASGSWARTEDEGAAMTHLQLLRRPLATVSLSAFREWAPGLNDPGGLETFVVVHHPELSGPLRDLGAGEFSCWLVSRSGARPARAHIEPEAFGPIQLEPHWPVGQLIDDVIAIVGVGSIGSAAASSLARLGIGELHLIDPDRLLWHNLVRHELGPASVGAFKADAMAHRLREETSGRAPQTTYSSHRLDVIGEAAALLEIAKRSDVVLCCSDGVESRRVVNHISRIAGKPVVFACVLADGSIGELSRYRPGTTFGCLLCHRRWLAERGHLDAEAEQDAPYGTGDSHRPMTASPSDLSFVGKLAAKMVASTLLESKHGEPGHSLPGEHCVIGLRPRVPLLGVFGVERSGEMRWGSVPAPRPDCPTCSLR